MTFSCGTAISPNSSLILVAGLPAYCVLSQALDIVHGCFVYDLGQAYGQFVNDTSYIVIANGNSSGNVNTILLMDVNSP